MAKYQKFVIFVGLGAFGWALSFGLLSIALWANEGPRKASPLHQIFERLSFTDYLLELLHI